MRGQLKMTLYSIHLNGEFYEKIINRPNFFDINFVFRK